jgi:hypothetical protein
VARSDDPRHCVVVEPAAGKLLVYWGTPKVVEALEATAWPGVYRARTEIQENSFQGMIGHGALDINYGRTQVVGPDRHQQRARATLAQSLDAAQKRVDKKADAVNTQQNQGSASESKGHGKRLTQRQRVLAELEKELAEARYQRDQRSEQAAALGPPGQRADRDFRKQKIMTFRTLWLENALRAFVAVWLGMLQTQVSLAQGLCLRFERRGARMETRTQVVYWVNTAGLSLPYRRLLAEMVDGLCAMDLRDQDTGIRVCLKDMSP